MLRRRGSQGVMVVQRNTALRDRHRRIIARDHPPCAICGQPIDYDLPCWNDMSFVVDHILPLAAGPSGVQPTEIGQGFRNKHVTSNANAIRT